MPEQCDTKKSRIHIHRIDEVGASPGTLTHRPDAPASVIRVIAYNEGEFAEESVDSADKLPKFFEKWKVTWIDVRGTKDVGTIEKLGEVLNLHKLALEDVVEGYQRPKADEYEYNIFVVAKIAVPSRTVELGQLSMFIGKNYILTFRDCADDSLEPVRNRIRKTSPRIRQNGADYLAYAILDAVVDGYFPVMEVVGERLENIEDEVLARPDSKVLADIHNIKRDLLNLRRALWPLREAINELSRSPNPIITEYTNLYFRDCYDHCVQLIDLIENYRDVSSGLTDVYLSGVSNKLNEVMKVLTIIATIFMPLSFFASLYGMNFNTQVSPFNMPELNWRFGYLFVWGIIIIVASVMLFYFGSKGWIGLGPRRK